MILVMKTNTTSQDVKELIAKLAWMNLQGISTEENGRYYIAIVSGADSHTDFKQFAVLPGVESILPFTQKFKLAGRELKKGRTVINIEGRLIGGGTLAVMAGPCSIESEEQIHQTAALVAASGANIFVAALLSRALHLMTFKVWAKQVYGICKALRRKIIC